MAITKVIFDVPMNLGIPGLTSLAREKKIKTGEGRYILFMNRKRTRVKILLDEETLFVYSPQSGAITVDQLKAIPSLFKGGEWMAPNTANHLERWLSSPLTTYASLTKAA